MPPSLSSSPAPRNASEIDDSPSEGVAAVDRALLIASALARADGPQTLAALARATGLYKSTLLRLLASLERAGLVVHRSDRLYAMGPLAFLFGRAFDATLGLKDRVQPVMQWLVAQGTESPSFHVRHGEGTRLCLLRLDSGHSTLDRVRAGDVLPMAHGAPGKVLNAFPRGLVPESSGPFVFTSYGERDPLCGAVAAPVFGPSDMLMGALSLSGPLERFSEDAVQRMSTLLLGACETATRALGGRWPSSSTVNAR